LAYQRKAVASAERFHALHKEVPERQGLSAQLSHIGLKHQLDPRLERSEPQHRRRAAEESLYAARGLVNLLEGEGPCMAEPARKHGCRRLMPRRGKQIGGCAGS